MEGGAHAIPSSAFLWEQEGGGHAMLWTKLTNPYNFQEGLPFSQPTPLLLVTLFGMAWPDKGGCGQGLGAE